MSESGAQLGGLTTAQSLRSHAEPRLSIVLIALALFAVQYGVTAAQKLTQDISSKTMLIEPPTPLLPATLGNLKRVSEGDLGDGMGQLDADDRSVLLEDGLKRLARSDYSGENHSTHVRLTVYQFNDASGAVAAYDYFRKSGMRPETLGNEAAGDRDQLLLRSGVNVVLEAPRLADVQAVALTKHLIDCLPKAFGSAGVDPPLPELLPGKGLDRDSVRYALGLADYRATGGVLPPQLVGFDQSAETVTARYKDKCVLTLIEYPTPQIAGEHERALGAELKRGGSLSGSAELRREGPLLIVATGPWKPADANSLISGIHLHDQLTWNKQMPLEFHAEVQKTYSLLVSIAILCGVGAVAAIVLGLFFGGGRALVRVLQGKPAATEPEFLRIDLRGRSGKRLRFPDA
jgi:hypothetical protein